MPANLFKRRVHSRFRVTTSIRGAECHVGEPEGLSGFRVKIDLWIFPKYTETKYQLPNNQNFKEATEKSERYFELNKNKNTSNFVV